MKFTDYFCQFSTLSLLSLTTTSVALAQITPDGTLPNNSAAVPQGTTIQIEGGTRAGGNLFHSFREFSVPTGGTAFFNNALDVQNILTRVTGGNISQIDGLLKANGSANLFLLNPNGIIFGPNAALNIGGSFLASTASSLKFADGTQFSTPVTHTTPLLSISVPIGLQLSSTSGTVVNQSRATIPESAQPVGLSVLPGQTLALVGKNVLLQGGLLTAPWGRIKLAAIQNGAIATFNNEPLISSPFIPDAASLPGDIQLSSAAAVNASGVGGGDVQITGDRIILTENSTMVADTLGDVNGAGITLQSRQLIIQDGSFISASTLGAGQGGNLTINAAESVDVSGTSANDQLFSALFSRTLGPGSAGNLTLTTRRLVLRDRGQISTETRSTGAGGNLTIQASDSIELIGSPIPADNINRVTGLFADSFPVQRDSDQPLPNAEAGPAGNITITTPKLSVREGAEIGAGAFGKGQGGSITINAPDFVEVTGVSPDELRFPSNLYVDSIGVGKGGELTITTGRLTLQDGGQITSGSFDQGNGGSLTINATQSIELSGSAPSTSKGEEIFFSLDGRFPSGLITSSLEAGTAGEVTLTTGKLTVRDGALIAVSNQGTGNAGNVTVNADSIVLENQGGITAVTTIGQGGSIGLNARSVQLNNGSINASVADEGTGGNIDIRASDSVEVVGVGWASLQNVLRAAISGTITLANLQTGIVTGTAGNGNAGDIRISTGKLAVREGGLVLAPTLSQGRAGNVFINTSDSIEVNGSFLAAVTTGIGSGGSVEINTRQLVVRNQGQVSSTTLGPGNAGDLRIHASDSVVLMGSSLPTLQPNGLSAAAFLGSSGAGGNLWITTPQLTIQNGSRVSVGSLGGNAGDMILEVGSLNLDNGNIIANSPIGRGGNIRLQVSNALILRNGSQISTRAGSENTGGGDGGNITINAATITALENSTINANAFAGTGGSIKISAQGLFSSSDSTITASSQVGVDGVVEVSRPDVDPSSGLVQLPEEVTDATEQIATSCAERGRNEFVVTGRSGLPEDPSQTLRGRNVWRDLRPLAEDRAVAQRKIPVSSQPSLLIEAQGWVRNAQGEVELVTRASHGSQNAWYNPTECGYLRRISS